MRDRRLVLSTSVYRVSPLLSRRRLVPAFALSILLSLLSLLLTPTLFARPLTEEDVLPPTHVIADHVVISEVQVGGSGADDEFIELYNPTASEVDMTGWRLTRKTFNGNTTENFRLSFPSETKIGAYGYFLIVSPEYTGSVIRDLTYNTGTRLAPNNTVILYRDQGLTVVDIVGYGTITNTTDGYEGNPYTPNPSNGQSIERKAFFFSTALDMNAGHANFGNSYDSGNNANDFILRTTPNPQSKISSSTPEPCCTTITGTLTLQGRAAHTGTEVLLWPGSGLRAATDSSGQFSIPNVPAIASAETSVYTVEVSSPGYLAPRTMLDLLDHLDEDGYLSAPVDFQELSLLAGDLNGDNRINIFDLAIVGSHYGNAGPSPADVNGDEVVNIQDLALISGNFGRENNYDWGPIP